MTKKREVPWWAHFGLAVLVTVLLCMIVMQGFQMFAYWSAPQPAIDQAVTKPITPAPAPEVDEKPVVVSPTPVTQPRVAEPTNGRSKESYTIRRGDTLSDVADRFGTTVEGIISTNAGNPAIKTRDIIIADKVLTIVKGEKQRTSPESVERKVPPEKSIERGGTSRAESFVVPHPASSPATTTLGKPVFPNHDCEAIAAHASGRIFIRGWFPTIKQVLDCIEVRYGNLIREAARLVGLDPHLLAAVIYVESKGDPLAVSPSGCLGLMQLLKSTAVQYRVNTAWIHDPRENLFGGARILADYLRRYARGDISWALAAYNLGPTGVSRKARSEGFVPSEAGYVRAVRNTLTLLKGRGQ